MVRVQHDHRVLRQLQAVQLVEDLARRRVRPRNLRVHIRSCQRSMSGLGFATTSEHAEIVKPGDNPLKFDAVDQKNRHRNFGFADVIKECVLQVLSVRSHCWTDFY